MITSNELRGCHVALITPMRPTNADRASHLVIDYNRLFSLINSCIAARVSGILLAGTTGQSACLYHDEQVDLIARASEYACSAAERAGTALRILASAGSNATHEALDLSRRIIETAHPDALLHVTGYYNNPPQHGLLRHFETIANLAGEHDTGVILYNIPGRTSSQIEVETIVQLAEHPAIVAIKEATGDLESVERIIAETDRDTFAVLSGEDHLVHDIIAHGGVGVISATANRWPREFQTLCNLALSGELGQAAELQQALQPCIDATFAVKNPIPLHTMFQTSLRLPLVGIEELDLSTQLQAMATIKRARAISSFPHVETTSVELAQNNAGAVPSC